MNADQLTSMAQLHAPAAAAMAMAERYAPRVKALEGALRLLITAYVATLEGGRDRILFLGGTCDDVPTMEAGDPALRHAKRVLAARETGAEHGK